MPHPVTLHEQEQLNRAAVQGMASSLRWERQNVYRMCPVGLWVDEAHFARDLARNDGTARSNAAQKWAAVSAIRGTGRGPDEIAAFLGVDVGAVSRRLGPIPLWAPGRARLAAIEEQERRMLGKQPDVPPAPASIDDPTIARVGDQGYRELAPLEGGHDLSGTPPSWRR